MALGFGVTLVIAGAIFALVGNLQALGWLLLAAGLLSMIVGLAAQRPRRQGRAASAAAPAVGRHRADDSSARIPGN